MLWKACWCLIAQGTFPGSTSHSVFWMLSLGPRMLCFSSIAWPQLGSCPVTAVHLVLNVGVSFGCFLWLQPSSVELPCPAFLPYPSPRLCPQGIHLMEGLFELQSESLSCPFQVWSGWADQDALTAVKLSHLFLPEPPCLWQEHTQSLKSQTPASLDSQLEIEMEPKF